MGYYSTFVARAELGSMQEYLLFTLLVLHYYTILLSLQYESTEELKWVKVTFYFLILVFLGFVLWLKEFQELECNDSSRWALFLLLIKVIKLLMTFKG